ncbi:MAG: DUF4296 domain-containing protein [Vicingaceae bacterium]|nr:DUF4296 domain-containing protein [Vicingaceae bacterium]
MLNKFIFILSILLFLSCSSSQNELPEGILTHEELVSVLTDIEIAQGYLKIKSSIDDSLFRSKAFQDNHYIHILKKHNITEEQFNNNIAYYSMYPEEMEKIYNDVIIAISQEQANYH